MENLRLYLKPTESGSVFEQNSQIAAHVLKLEGTALEDVKWKVTLNCWDTCKEMSIRSYIHMNPIEPDTRTPGSRATCKLEEIKLSSVLLLPSPETRSVKGMSCISCNCGKVNVPGCSKRPYSWKYQELSCKPRNLPSRCTISFSQITNFMCAEATNQVFNASWSGVSWRRSNESG